MPGKTKRASSSRGITQVDREKRTASANLTLTREAWDVIHHMKAEIEAKTGLKVSTSLATCAAILRPHDWQLKTFRG
jgi:hypothetical protein